MDIHSHQHTEVRTKTARWSKEVFTSLSAVHFDLTVTISQTCKGEGEKWRRSYGDKTNQRWWTSSTLSVSLASPINHFDQNSKQKKRKEEERRQDKQNTEAVGAIPTPISVVPCFPFPALFLALFRFTSTSQKHHSLSTSSPSSLSLHTHTHTL